MTGGVRKGANTSTLREELISGKYISKVKVPDDPMSMESGPDRVMLAVSTAGVCNQKRQILHHNNFSGEWDQNTL